jgi:phosphoribosyl 1,2-cyclic phosphate phosphodiesterase
LISWENQSLIIDCGPDFYSKCLLQIVKKVDAILFTHEHADHTAGIDDIRPFNFKQGKFLLRPSKSD